MKLSFDNSIAISRLTTLWAINESALGGILHAFKSPFIGMIVGGIAVIIISLLCFLSRNNWKTVLSALIIVLIIKMGISPHASLTAYVAVAFQAFAGLTIFTLISNRFIACFLFAVIAILESAFQKLILLAVIYGKGLWEAMDNFGIWLSQLFDYNLEFSTAYVIILSYLILNLFAGIIIGYFSFKLINRIEKSDLSQFELVLNEGDQTKFSITKTKSASRILYVFLFILISISLILYFTEGAQSTYPILYIIIRSLSIILLWFLVFSPFLTHWLKKYLANKKENLNDQLQEATNLMPYITYIIKYAWKETASLKIIPRIAEFVYLIILYSIHFKIKENDHIDG